nr:reverse transcriptase domain-containing protein [Tanacetum cinerariifolium]
MDPYEEVTQQGQVLPLLPAYVLDPIELDEHVPIYIPEPEQPKHHAPSDDDIQVKDQPHADDDSPTAESPGYIDDSDLMGEDDDEDPSEEYEPEDDNEDPKEDPNEEPKPEEEDTKEEELSKGSDETEPFEEDETICMRTRRSYFPITTNVTIPRRRLRKHTSNVVEPDIRTIVEMADNRTMAQMLQAPIEGYEDAIVVPPINANNFELKHPEVPNTAIKLLLFPFSLEGEARIWLDKEPSRSFCWVKSIINPYNAAAEELMLLSESKDCYSNINVARLKLKLFKNIAAAEDITKIMHVTRQGTNDAMTLESIQAMIDRAIQRNSTHTQDDASQSSGGGLERHVQHARVCSYTDFMKCQPLNFKGTEGVVGLSQWLEKMQSVFHISGCAIVLASLFSKAGVIHVN